MKLSERCSFGGVLGGLPCFGPVLGKGFRVWVCGRFMLVLQD